MSLEERIKSCKEEVEVILKKYELALDVTMELKANSVRPIISLLNTRPNPPAPQDHLAPKNPKKKS